MFSRTRSLSFSLSQHRLTYCSRVIFLQLCFFGHSVSTLGVLLVLPGLPSGSSAPTGFHAHTTCMRKVTLTGGLSDRTPIAPDSSLWGSTDGPQPALHHESSPDPSPLPYLQQKPGRLLYPTQGPNQYVFCRRVTELFLTFFWHCF